MLRHKPDVTNDELLMFRCLIAIAHADHVFEATEKQFIQNIIDGNNLNPEQRQLLESDMVSPQPVETLFSEIKDPVNRAQIVHFARIMAYKDGELEPAENAILAKLHAHAMQHVDRDKLRGEIKDSVALQMQTHDAKMGEPIPSWFEKLENFLNSLGLKI